MTDFKPMEEIYPQIADLMKEDFECGFEQVERRLKDSRESVSVPGWSTVFSNSNCYLYRIKPKMIQHPGGEYPAPEKEAPEDGTFCFLADPSSSEKVYSFYWATGNDNHSRWLAAGLIHLTEENAITHCNVMLGGGE